MPISLKTKKIIARELILLIILFIAGVFFFFGTYFYNKYIESKYHPLEYFAIAKAAEGDSIISKFKNKYPKADLYYLSENDTWKLNNEENDMRKTGMSENIIRDSTEEYKRLNGVAYKLTDDLYGSEMDFNNYPKKFLFTMSSRKHLYLKMKFDGLYSRTYSDFERQYNDSTNIEALYLTFHANKEYTKSKSAFFAQFFNPLNENNFKIVRDSTIIEMISVRQDQIIALKNTIYTLTRRKLSNEKRTLYTVEVMIMLFVIMFFLRYLVCAILWCVRILRTK